MMFLHEQNETELILTGENLWPLSLVCKSLLFPCLRQGNNSNIITLTSVDAIKYG
jgi:hypothetical protein